MSDEPKKNIEFFLDHMPAFYIFFVNLQSDKNSFKSLVVKIRRVLL